MQNRYCFAEVCSCIDENVMSIKPHFTGFNDRGPSLEQALLVVQLIMKSYYYFSIWKLMTSYAGVVVLVLMLSGCVGIETDHPKSKTTKITEIAKFADIYVVDYKRKLWSKTTHPVNGIVILKSERVWCGSILWVVFPIPLKLPLCENYRAFTFVDDKPVLEVEKWVSGPSYHMCGPFIYMASMITPRGGRFCWLD